VDRRAAGVAVTLLQKRSRGGRTSTRPQREHKFFALTVMSTSVGRRSLARSLRQQRAPFLEDQFGQQSSGHSSAPLQVEALGH
jgi:hypothetical protein